MLNKCQLVVSFRFLIIFVGLALQCGCKNNRYQVNEENPFYKKGMKLQEDGKYKDAIAVFKKCLFYSPDSYKADLQLALIYEDHEHDFPQAIVHYKFYLNKVSDEEDIDIAEQWLGRAEKKYFDELRFVYGDPVGGDSPESHFEDDYSVESKKRLGDNEQSTGYKISDVTVIPEEKINRNDASDATNTPTEESPKKETKNRTILAGNSDHQKYIEHYIVKQGDTLAYIAEERLGNQVSWQELYEYNKDILASPERLQIGQKLRIPPAANE